MDEEPPARDHQRASHGGNQLFGNRDLALGERERAVANVAALGGAGGGAHDFVADIGRGDQAGDVDVIPGCSPAKARGEVPSQAQGGIVGPAGEAGARVEDGVGALDDGCHVGRSGREGLGGDFQPDGDIGAALAAVCGGPLAA